MSLFTVLAKEVSKPSRHKYKPTVASYCSARNYYHFVRFSNAGDQDIQNKISRIFYWALNVVYYLEERK